MHIEEKRIVDDPAAIRALGTPEKLSHLVPFWRGPCSLAQASRELQVPLPRLYSWVHLLLGCGLLHVTHTEQRTGKPIKYYAVTARAFVIPAALLPETYVSGHPATWNAHLQRALAHHAPFLTEAGDLQIRLDEQGKINLNRVSDEGETWDPLALEHPAVLNTWMGSLRLSREDAKALQAQLMAVANGYLTRTGQAEGEPYILHLALAPQWPLED